MMVIEIALGVWLGLTTWTVTRRLVRAALAYWLEWRHMAEFRASTRHFWAKRQFQKEWAR